MRERERERARGRERGREEGGREGGRGWEREERGPGAGAKRGEALKVRKWEGACLRVCVRVCRRSVSPSSWR